MRELETLYEKTRTRIAELVTPVKHSDSVEVPACPEWSVKDVVSHLTGNCADVLNGNLEGVATAEWTAAQVDERREWPLEDVLAQWDDLSPKFAAFLDDLPGYLGRNVISDLVVHEQDLRGALGKPGHRDDAAVVMGADFAMRVVVDSGAIALGLGPLEVTAGDNWWLVGTGGPATNKRDGWKDIVGAEVIARPVNKARVGTVVAPPFELFRAITGRRSANQIRSFDWNVDPEPFIPLFGSDPFTVRDTDLVE